MTRRMSLCMDVRGFLSSSKFPEDYRGMFKKDDGTTMSPAEARESLFDQIANGRHVIPMSPSCRNPCMHADKGCAGFNYGEGGGCPGYTIPAAAEAAS